MADIRTALLTISPSHTKVIKNRVTTRWATTWEIDTYASGPCLTLEAAVTTIVGACPVCNASCEYPEPSGLCITCDIAATENSTVNGGIV